MMIDRRRLLAGLLLSSTALAIAPAGLANVLRPRKRPNIITIVLDDVGYSDVGCFGGEIRTPNIDRLASRGVRFNHFDTKAVCSCTRASLLTGRNCHTVNFPDVPDLSAKAGEQGYSPELFHLPANAQSLAQALRNGGYATWTVGKWHLIPADQLAEGARRDTWPLQHGFDYFYGFARGWTDQYHPDLVENNDHIHPELPEDYHLSVDLVDKAVALIDRHRTGESGRPFYLNLAFGAAHAPLQVPARYSDPYDAVYQAGWDAIREQRIARMKRMGVIPRSTLLPPRNPDDRAWNDLSEDERVVFARFMAVYAGFLEHADEQIGRLFSHLEQNGLWDDTIIVLLSDNGAASEAGQAGDFDGLYRPNQLTPAQERARLSELGTAKTEAEYPRPWAMAGVTPLRRYKLWPYAGGTRTPMIVSWPTAIPDPGALRPHFIDVIDIAPTLLDIVGLGFDEQVNGVSQLPVAGQSFRSVLLDERSPATRSTQYFELRGNRAITHGDWRAVAIHRCDTDYDSDRWELFNLRHDFSESNDLSARYGERLKQMQALWQSEWHRYAPGPLEQPRPLICRMNALD